MVIKASSAAEIRQLVEALSGDDPVRCEAAIARLAVIGPRAIDGLVAAYRGSASLDGRIAILRALEASADRRAVVIIREALSGGGDLAVAATSTLRTLLDSADQRTATEALDILVAAALDADADRRVRLAAFEALRDVPGGVRERVAEALERDPDATLKARAIDAPREAATADAVWQDALDGRLPDTPAVLRDAAQSRSSSAPLGLLRHVIDQVRAREGMEERADRRAEWQSVRGALHQALALRGSRVAVYDLRESLDQASGKLPVSFLAALHVVGDESCLEPLAAAWSRAAPEDAHWRHQIATAFRMIARRERITRRHAAIKRIAARWPGAIDELYGR